MESPAGYKKIPVKTWFLTYSGKLPEKPSPDTIKRWKNPSVDEYLEIYKVVGGDWGWTDRLLKSKEEVSEILNSPNNELWFFWAELEIAGFFELERMENETELVYLGLKPEWIGKRLGQKLIQAAVYIAGQDEQKVWLHTCERDHAAALREYLKAGFKIEKELVSMEYYPE